MKVCSKCKVEKPLDCFYFRKDTGKYKTYCKTCHSAACKSRYESIKDTELHKSKVRDYYLNNSDRIKARAAKWEAENWNKAQERKAESYRKLKAANPNAVLERSRRYRVKHPERVKQGAREYYEKNSVKIKARRRNYDQAYPEKSAAKTAKRRGRKLNATPHWLIPEQLEEINDFYEITKAFRLYTGVDYCVDHIIPLQGKTVCGLHVPWNLQVLTESDNARKSNKFEEE